MALLGSCLSVWDTFTCKGTVGRVRSHHLAKNRFKLLFSRVQGIPECENIGTLKIFALHSYSQHPLQENMGCGNVPSHFCFEKSWTIGQQQNPWVHYFIHKLISCCTYTYYYRSIKWNFYLFKGRLYFWYGFKMLEEKRVLSNYHLCAMYSDHTNLVKIISNVNSLGLWFISFNSKNQSKRSIKI